MKDILSLAVFAGKLLCLMVFVTVLKPDGSIGAVKTSAKSAECSMARSRIHGCGSNILATTSEADVGPCSARPSVAQC
ncbi:hypothetical protein ACVWYQ_006664 [Bradyrhizobium sp. USDA 3397]